MGGGGHVRRPGQPPSGQGLEDKADGDAPQNNTHGAPAAASATAAAAATSRAATARVRMHEGSEVDASVKKKKIAPAPRINIMAVIYDAHARAGTALREPLAVTRECE